jgi:uncharacterized protein YndB with AHSA1/START domain
MRTEDLGTYSKAGDGTVELRFERVYPRPIETVWAAMTQPERLADWMGECRVEPRVGGRFDVFVNRDEDAQVHGEVTAWDPPRALEFTWSSLGEAPSRVRAELSEAGEGKTRLVFTHRGMEPRWMGLTFPGWHQLLERLNLLMTTGAAAPDFEGRWRELQGLYFDRYGFGEGVMRDPPLPMEKYK